MQHYATELFEWPKLESLEGRPNGTNKQDDGVTELSRLASDLTVSRFILDFPKFEFQEKLEKEGQEPKLDLHNYGPDLTSCQDLSPPPWWTIKYSWFKSDKLPLLK